jgi:formiminotetrahydrofolate cyclodeaminase
LASSDLLQKTVAELLDEIAAETAAPGGGAVAAVVVGMGAALVEMVARFSGRSWDGADAALARAQALRARVAPLAQADAAAYSDLLAARRRPADDPGREEALAAANARVVEVPLEVAAAAAEVAALAAILVDRGNPNLRGDAVAASLAARAGAQAAAALVEINLAGRADERLDRARDLAASSTAAAERALAAGDAVTSPVTGPS